MFYDATSCGTAAYIFSKVNNKSLFGMSVMALAVGLTGLFTMKSLPMTKAIFTQM